MTEKASEEQGKCKNDTPCQSCIDLGVTAQESGAELEQLMFSLYHEPMPEYDWTELKIKQLLDRARRDEREKTIEECVDVAGNRNNYHHDQSAAMKTKISDRERLDWVLKNTNISISKHSLMNDRYWFWQTLIKSRKQLDAEIRAGGKKK